MSLTKRSEAYPQKWDMPELRELVMNNGPSFYP